MYKSVGSRPGLVKFCPSRANSSSLQDRDEVGTPSTSQPVYTLAMRSVADDLRDELQEELLGLSFEERMALVLRLGERGLQLFCQANGLDRKTAIRELQRQRQAGRTPSKCMSELIG